MEKEITAAEWLAIELYEKIEMRGDGNLIDEILEKAKEMEKQQIIDAYHTGGVDGQIFALQQKLIRENGEEYYNEIFKEEI